MDTAPMHQKVDAAHRAMALRAARHCTDAAQELLRFHAEGPVCNWPFGDVEVIAELAQAIRAVARIECTALEAQPAYAAYRADALQLAAFCTTFLIDQGGAAHPAGDGIDAFEIEEAEVPY